MTSTLDWMSRRIDEISASAERTGRVAATTEILKQLQDLRTEYQNLDNQIAVAAISTALARIIGDDNG